MPNYRHFREIWKTFHTISMKNKIDIFFEIYCDLKKNLCSLSLRSFNFFNCFEKWFKDQCVNAIGNLFLKIGKTHVSLIAIRNGAEFRPSLKRVTALPVVMICFFFFFA